MKDGGYDIGYKKCSCFWGTQPGSLLSKLDNYIPDLNGLNVLDLGCGEGKNAFHMANNGCRVDAFDISKHAIRNAKLLCENNDKIKFEVNDVKNIPFHLEVYDIIIAYGLYHCFKSMEEVQIQIENSIKSLKPKGFYVVCAFNSRKQDLSAHDGFEPLLLEHNTYVSFFSQYNMLYETDEDLFETHPHNNIPHMHSMTRLIIQK